MSGAGLPQPEFRAITRPSGIVNDGGGGARASAYRSLASSARALGQSLATREIRAGEDDARAALASGEERERQFTDLFGLRDDAYTNTLQVLALARAQEAGEREIAELQQVHAGSPSSFREAANAYLAAYVEEQPQTARSAVQALLGREIANAESSLVVDRIRSDQREAVAALDARIDRAQSEVETLAAANEINTPRFERARQELVDLYTIKADNPVVEYSDEEMQLDLDRSSASVMSAYLRPRLAERYETLGYAEALELADELAQSVEGDPERQQVIRQNLRQEVNLLRQNEAAAIAADEAQARQNDRFTKQRRDAVGRDIVDRLSDPDAPRDQTLAFIRANRDLFSPSTYQGYINDALRTEANSIPENRFLMLEAMVRRGEVSLTELSEIEGMTAGQRSALSSAYEQSRRAVNRAGDLIFDGAFRQSAFEMDVALSVREARARERFARWLEDNPEATTDQARLYAKEVVLAEGRVYAAQSYSRYLGDEQLGAVTAEAMASAEEQLFDDLEAGTITEAEAEREAKIIATLKRLTALD